MRTPILLLALLATLNLPRLHASGLIIVDKPVEIAPHHPHHRHRPIQRYLPLEVREHHISVDIANGVATTSVDQTFYNPTGGRLEGTYIFPLPEGAEIDGFEMDVNGTMTPAELLDATKARSIYEEIVRKAKDPALMEYSGRGCFKVRIFPIEPRSEKRVKIKYTQVLQRDGRISGYRCPLDTEKYSARPVKSVSLKATIESGAPLKSIYSPTHEIDLTRKGKHRAIVGFEQSNALLDTDFELFFSTGGKKGDGVGLELLTYRDPKSRDGADGYFMMMLSPGAWEAKRAAPKDVVFAVDTSGSMRVDKLDQAKAALAFCIDSLGENDRFEIVRYSTEAEPLFDQLRPATRQNIDEAQQFIEDLRAGGGTAIEEALLMGVSHAADRKDRSRPYQVIFLTDGRPTIGETRPEKIIARLGDTLNNSDGAVRVFSFGIGTDINTKLLDRIATETKAATEYILPSEDLELKVSRLYSKISEPVMTDLKIQTSGGVRLSGRHPGNLPDMFKGDQLVVFGRYTPSKKKAKEDYSIRLNGTVDGEKESFRYPVSFANRSTEHEFIPRLWATRRVGYLLDQIRLGGDKEELEDEVVALARRWGIVTPYTSYLIIEDEEARAVPLARQTMGRRGLGLERGDPTPAEAPLDDLRRKERAAYDAFAANDTGEDAIRASRFATELKGATRTIAGKPSPSKKSPQAAGAASTAPSRSLAGKTFYQNGDVWTDSEAPDIEGEPTRIVFASPNYFDLVAKDARNARWLSLGDRILVVIDAELIEIVPAKEK